jgi:hypothetical protein
MWDVTISVTPSESQQRYLDESRGEMGAVKSSRISPARTTDVRPTFVRSGGDYGFRITLVGKWQPGLQGNTLWPEGLPGML